MVSPSWPDNEAACTQTVCFVVVVVVVVFFFFFFMTRARRTLKRK